jgi:hypothetical protein
MGCLFLWNLRGQTSRSFSFFAGEMPKKGLMFLPYRPYFFLFLSFEISPCQILVKRRKKEKWRLGLFSFCFLSGLSALKQHPVHFSIDFNFFCVCYAVCHWHREATKKADGWTRIAMENEWASMLLLPLCSTRSFFSSSRIRVSYFFNSTTF